MLWCICKPLCRMMLLCCSVWRHAWLVSAFIVGIAISNSLAEYAIAGNLMKLLSGDPQNKPFLTAIATINIKEGLTALMAIIGSYMADAGHYYVAPASVAFNACGFLFFTLSVHYRIPLFYLAFTLMAIGEGGQRHTLKKFVNDQFKKHNDKANWLSICCPNLQAKFHLITWWNIGWFLGFWLAFIIFQILSKEASISKKWTIFGTCTTTFMLVAFFFLMSGILYYKGDDSRPGLNRNETAEVNEDITQTVQVKETKLYRLFPIWITLLMYGIVLSMGKTTFIEQASTLDAKLGPQVEIPVTYLLAIYLITKTLTPVAFHFLVVIKTCIPLLNSLNRKIIRPKVRIGMGLFLSALCCLTAALVEKRRSRIMATKRSSMSIFWLVPQSWLLGAMDGLVSGGIEDLFDSRPALIFSESVKGIGNILSLITMVLTNQRRHWFAKEIGDSHLDSYYFMLTVVCLINLCFYLFVVYCVYHCKRSC